MGCDMPKSPVASLVDKHLALAGMAETAQLVTLDHGPCVTLCLGAAVLPWLVLLRLH